MQKHKDSEKNIAMILLDKPNKVATRHYQLHRIDFRLTVRDLILTQVIPKRIQPSLKYSLALGVSSMGYSSQIHAIYIKANRLLTQIGIVAMRFSPEYICTRKAYNDSAGSPNLCVQLCSAAQLTNTFDILHARILAQFLRHSLKYGVVKAKVH